MSNRARQSAKPAKGPTHLPRLAARATWRGRFCSAKGGAGKNHSRARETARTRAGQAAPQYLLFSSGPSRPPVARQAKSRIGTFKQ